MTVIKTTEDKRTLVLNLMRCIGMLKTRELTDQDLAKALFCFREARHEIFHPNETFLHDIERLFHIHQPVIYYGYVLNILQKAEEDGRALLREEGVDMETWLDQAQGFLSRHGVPIRCSRLMKWNQIGKIRLMASPYGGLVDAVQAVEDQNLSLVA